MPLPSLPVPGLSWLSKLVSQLQKLLQQLGKVPHQLPKQLQQLLKHLQQLPKQLGAENLTLRSGMLIEQQRSPLDSRHGCASFDLARCPVRLARASSVRLARLRPTTLMLGPWATWRRASPFTRSHLLSYPQDLATSERLRPKFAQIQPDADALSREVLTVLAPDVSAVRPFSRWAHTGFHTTRNRRRQCM